MANSAFLTLVNVSPVAWRYEVTPNRQVIGRGDAADIRLPEEHCHASRRHAEIWHDAKGIWVLDLKSRGGTRLNGIWLRPESQVRIVLGDRLSLAGVELRLCGFTKEPKRSPAEADSRDSANLETAAYSEVRVLELEISTLSLAELKVLLWMRRGYDRDEDLSRMLHRSPHTIRTQVASIFQKLGVRSRASVLSLLHRVDMQSAD